MALFAAYCVYNTTMNNAYEYGSTFYDSAEFATVLWHSGLTLFMGPAFGGSIYSTHASTINYFPTVLSYLWMGERMDFYALVYACVYAATIFTAFRLLLRLAPAPWMAALGAFMLFCGEIIFGGSWEMRSDYVAPLCMLMAFSAWQLRRYRACLVWFILTTMVREDLGLMAAAPLALLAGWQFWVLRKSDRALAREKRGWALRILIVTVVWTMATIYVQKHFFQVYDLFHEQYYDAVDPFHHLSAKLIADRAWHLFSVQQGIWLPLVALAVAGVWFKDVELLIGAVAFAPYLLAMFFSKSEMSAQWSSYKPFVLVLCVMWPAVMALARPENERRRYAVLQAVVLVCGLASMRAQTFHQAASRWLPQPLVSHANLYREFGQKQLEAEGSLNPNVRASHGVLALYPYQFGAYWSTWIVSIKPEEMGNIQTLIWFRGDRDQPLIDKALMTGSFDIKDIEGTKLRVAHRR